MKLLLRVLLLSSSPNLQFRALLTQLNIFAVAILNRTAPEGGDDQLFTDDFCVQNVYENMFYIPQRGTSSLVWVGITKDGTSGCALATSSSDCKFFCWLRLESIESRGGTLGDRNNSRLDSTMRRRRPSLFSIFHTFHRGTVNMMSRDKAKGYINSLYDWTRSSTGGRPSRNVTPTASFWYAPMEWIRGITGKLRTSVVDARVNLSEEHRLHCMSAKLLDYNLNSMEVACQCNDEGTLCTAAFACHD